MSIETPERYMHEASSADRYLEKLENKAECIKAEIREIEAKSKDKHIIFGKRKLKDRKRKLEKDLKFTESQIDNLTKSIFRSEV